MMDVAVVGKLREFGELLRMEAAPRGLIGFDAESLEVVEEQIARSLVLLEALGRPERLVDVGSGAGLPGIPLMIVLGDGVLVEPKRRAATFLESVIRRLDLRGSVFVGTAEEAGRGPLREWGDAVVARAVGSPSVTVELCSPLCAQGGTVLLTAAPDSVASDVPERVCRTLGLGPAESRTLVVSGPRDAHSAADGAEAGSGSLSFEGLSLETGSFGLASDAGAERFPLLETSPEARDAGGPSASSSLERNEGAMGPSDRLAGGNRGEIRRAGGFLGGSGRAIEQRVLMMSKVAPTPSAFPRRPGTARRRPLDLDLRS